MALAWRMGTWERLDLFVVGQDPASTSANARAFGLPEEKLAQGITHKEALEQLNEFIASGVVMAPAGSTFERWMEHSELSACATCPAELAALLTPGRQTENGLELTLNNSSPDNGDTQAPLTPAHLIQACAGIVDGCQSLPSAVLQVAAAGYGKAHHHLRATDPSGARRLGLLLGMTEHPSSWNNNPPDGETAPLTLRDGLLSQALAPGSGMKVLPPRALPRWHQEASKLEEFEPVPPRSPDERPLNADELSLVDDLFAIHLPQCLALEHGIDAQLCLRPSQQSVARAVAEMFGTQKLLLIHAPTGTGKTLAYLLPAMIWAKANGVRVGLATYTRALQEQVMDQEVPRAHEALARAGETGSFSVNLLKGRSNYLCWRALEQLEPEPDAEPERWLAWTGLVLFGLTHGTGDLDCFPKRSPVRLESARDYRRATSHLLANSRAQTGCCLDKSAARTCAAHVARRRAERSNVVIMNHALVLTSPEFVRTVVFDECEHLHDSAASAWEHRIDFPTARSHINRLHGGSRGGVLDRLCKGSLTTTAVGDDLKQALQSAAICGDNLTWLEEEAARYGRWRRTESQKRGPQGAHSLLGEYLSGEESELVKSRTGLIQALMDLDSTCAVLMERLAETELPGAARSRRQLEVSRGDINTLRSSLDNWLPMRDDTIKLDNTWWYEVETDAAGESVLVATPLLPHELLGSQFYPDLQSAAFLSATTKMRGSFDGALRYLGLHYVAQEREDEAWTPRTVETVAAPEVFDYSRVFVGLMRDAPEVHDKDRFLDYTSRLIESLTNCTRGRTLVLFTSLSDCRQVGERLRGSFEERHLPLWYQGMPGIDKEELATLFRDRTDSVLLGVDTFWYGADFPGETLEYLILARLPYGVPDAFHHAQCALMGTGVQRESIYMPRGLAKFRQGFGRLMRRTTDRGCVLILDKRVASSRHRAFLQDLPLAGFRNEDGARILQGETDRILVAALKHMGVDRSPVSVALDQSHAAPVVQEPVTQEPVPNPAPEAGPLEIAPEDIPW